MTGRRIVLADGQRLENAVAGYSDGFLWVHVPAITEQECVPIFTNKAKTETIVFQYGEMQDTYNGFTQMVRILPGEEVSVCMTTPKTTTKDGAE